MKKELSKLNKEITKNNEKFHKFYNRTNLPYPVAKEQWIRRQENIEKKLKIIAFIIIAVFIAALISARIILN